jgi:hyperosmotically inducible periplasmic protein
MTFKFSKMTAAGAVAVAVLVSGCAVSRGQETVGAYVDDAAITTSVKTRLFDDKDVAGSSISVETLNGTVMLSGFAKNGLEKNRAEKIARDVKGVMAVKNEILIRP